MNDRNRAIIDEFRQNEGKVGGGFQGAPLLLLSSVGAKTGRRLTTPLMYLPDDDRVIVFASKGGADSHPAWFHNLMANPSVSIEVGTETIKVAARRMQGEERDRLYARQAALYPQFAGYEAKTTRRIPVVALEREG